jgi:hypothetical protein
MISVGMTPKVLGEVAKWKGILAAIKAEDADWDWTAIVRESRINQRKRIDRHEYLVLRCQGEVQGLSILEIRHHVSPRTGDPLVYVEYVAVAPWNRLEIQNARRYSGCGRVLLLFATERSVALGFGGIVGLHSLPGAQAFYRGMGFKDLGPDPQEAGLHYFEFRG